MTTARARSGHPTGSRPARLPPRTATARVRRCRRNLHARARGSARRRRKEMEPRRTRQAWARRMETRPLVLGTRRFLLRTDSPRAPRSHQTGSGSSRADDSRRTWSSAVLFRTRTTSRVTRRRRCARKHRAPWRDPPESEKYRVAGHRTYEGTYLQGTKVFYEGSYTYT